MPKVMNESTRTVLRELAEWRPEAGVISVYLDIDPADRGGGWRIALEQELKRLVKEAEPGKDREATERTAEAILERFPADAPHRGGRAQIGFVAAHGERAIWRSLQARLEETAVVRDVGPRLAPLISLLERSQPVGVVLASRERLRILERADGTLADLEDWEIEMWSRDWRERRSPRRDPQRDGTGTTASGRDQHDQRLEHNRARFLKEAGELIEERYGDRDWQALLIFGDADVPGQLAQALGSLGRIAHECRGDLVRAPIGDIQERIESELMALVERRQADLLDRADEAVATGGAAAGVSEVLGTLEQGRAGHVIVDPGGDFKPHEDEAAVEAMLRLGLTTSAEVTAISDEQFAARLAEHGGAVALLRY